MSLARIGVIDLRKQLYYMELVSPALLSACDSTGFADVFSAFHTRIHPLVLGHSTSTPSSTTSTAIPTELKPVYPLTMDKLGIPLPNDKATTELQPSWTTWALY